MRRWLVALSILLACGPARAFAKEIPCASLADAELGDSVQVTEATPVAERTAQGTEPALPGYCRIRGMIDQRVGVGGKPYGIGFEVALPNDWNERFLFQGGGGLNGVVRPATGNIAAGGNPALARGFAVASTDSGHKGANFDASFREDQRASLDFAYAALGRVADAAKRLIVLRYGRAAARSYFAGCSTGGKEAMIAAQRFPDAFDGIIAGAPAMRTGHSNLALANAQVAFNRIAPRDAGGMPITYMAFPPADKALILRALLAACDGRDGREDGIIADPVGCRFDPAILACSGAKTADCLSKEQVHALQFAFAGPRSITGAQIYPGFPYDTGIVAESDPIPGFLPSAKPGPLGPPRRDMSIDVDALWQKVQDDANQRLVDSWPWTNLSSFLGHGGKLILYHGVSDPWFSAWDTVGWFERAQAANGGPDKWGSAARMYLVPGMGHCSGGNAFDRFDLLDPLVNWVEHSSPPQAVTASQKSETMPLCPYPKAAVATGKRFQCVRLRPDPL
ncbi:tannase/feruloyl esterase family alpha/beta hydrolase [Sphingobium ummariense]